MSFFSSKTRSFFFVSRILLSSKNSSLLSDVSNTPIAVATSGTSSFITSISIILLSIVVAYLITISSPLQSPIRLLKISSAFGLTRSSILRAYINKSVRECPISSYQVAEKYLKDLPQADKPTSTFADSANACLFMMHRFNPERGSDKRALRHSLLAGDYHPGFEAALWLRGLLINDRNRNRSVCATLLHRFLYLEGDDAPRECTHLAG